MKNLRKLLIPLLIISTMAISGCKTVPVQDPQIPLYSDIVPMPERPVLEKIPESMDISDPVQLSEFMKLMGINLLNTTTHIEKLEGYIIRGEKYYKTIHTIVP